MTDMNGFYDEYHRVAWEHYGDQQRREALAALGRRYGVSADLAEQTHAQEQQRKISNQSALDSAFAEAYGLDSADVAISEADALANETHVFRQRGDHYGESMALDSLGDLYGVDSSAALVAHHASKNHGLGEV